MGTQMDNLGSNLFNLSKTIFYYNYLKKLTKQIF